MFGGYKMLEKSKTFEIQKEIVKTETDKKRFILDYTEKTNTWHFHAVEASNYSEEQLESILNELKKLNGTRKEE